MKRSELTEAALAAQEAVFAAAFAAGDTGVGLPCRPVKNGQ